MAHRPFPQKQQDLTRINQKIRAREVLTIGQDGRPLGVLSIQDALEAARRAGLDLVEVSPNSNPPVCKILDYGKYRYEEAKRKKESRHHQSANKVKELKFHANIDSNDYMVKVRQAERFLLKGHKTKILMVFRGREMAHKDIGFEVVQRIRQDLVHVATPDAEPKLIGRNITLMLIPLPERKRVRRWTKEDDVEDADESGDGEN